MSQAPGEDAAAAARERERAEDSLSALIYESDTETKRKKKTAHKSPKSPKSPYTSTTYFHSKRAGFSRSFKGTESKNFEIPLVKSSRQLWRGSLKQGTRMGKGRSDPDIGAALSTLPSSTPEYLKEALGMKKPKHARSSSSGYIPGTPDYKEKEDMYDEIIELKKTIQAQKNEGDRMKTKLRRMEEENNRKDKQIEQLLDPSRGSEFSWVRPDLKTDTSLVISGLKQKILRLEQQCKEKDNTINKLQTDVKSRNVEEMRIALETYYEEVQRLQILLAKSKAVQRKSSSESSQQKALNTTTLQFSRSIKELRDENRKLKANLDHMLRSSPALGKAKNYTEWSRQRLVRQIAKLEQKIDGLQNDRLQLSQTSTSPLPSPSASAHLDVSIAKESDPPEDIEHLHKIIKKLKSQRVVLQDQLALKEEEIRKLTEKVRKLEKNQEIHPRRSGIDATEPPDQGPQEFHPGCQRPHSTSMQHLMGSNLVFSPPCSAERHREEQAAQVIQRRWKAYKTKVEGIALEKKTPDLSSPLQTTADGSMEEEVVRLIQSVFRAHITRTQLKERSLTFSPKSEKASPVAHIGEEKPVWSPFRCSLLAFTSVPTTSVPAQQQPSPPPFADEVHSDDSDDIITVSPSPVKKTSSLDFHSCLPRSLSLS